MIKILDLSKNEDYHALHDMIGYGGIDGQILENETHNIRPGDGVSGVLVHKSGSDEQDKEDEDADLDEGAVKKVDKNNDTDYDLVLNNIISHLDNFSGVDLKSWYIPESESKRTSNADGDAIVGYLEGYLQAIRFQGSDFVVMVDISDPGGSINVLYADFKFNSVTEFVVEGGVVRQTTGATSSSNFLLQGENNYGDDDDKGDGDDDENPYQGDAYNLIDFGSTDDMSDNEFYDKEGKDLPTLSFESYKHSGTDVYPDSPELAVVLINNEIDKPPKRLIIRCLSRDFKV